VTDARDSPTARVLMRPGSARGWFIAFEGGEGAGKSTQTEALAQFLRGNGHEVVVTFEPGDTPVGQILRGLLLGHEAGTLAPRTEALLFAADRAEHVAAVIRPALERGAVVITDRYIDSSLAYQGAGRTLPVDEVAQLSAWASQELTPDLTVLLDLPARSGLQRVPGTADRMEAEPLAFHERVRGGFLDLAARHPDRYLVVDATETVDVIAERIRAGVTDLVAAAKVEPR
jgi:dTMP kinase